MISRATVHVSAIPGSAEPPRPSHRPICEDERRYVGYSGQTWTTLEALRRTHHTVLKVEEENLTGIGREPVFAIGQRALLVRDKEGNIQWDCIPLVDERSIAGVKSLGGISGTAISHPHYYSSMVEWSRAFGGVPIYLHADDRQWAMRPDPAIEIWEGETRALPGGVTLIRCSGHFEGGTVLHWPDGAQGRGGLLSGDMINAVSDRRFVSFTRSCPNLIPLHRTAFSRIEEAVHAFAFDRIDGAWFGKVVQAGAKQSVEATMERYLKAIAG